MAALRLRIHDSWVGLDYSPFYIAELCNNFKADLGRAKALADRAAASGVHAIKAQLRLRDDRLSIAGHEALASHCESLGVPMFWSVFGPEGLAALANLPSCAVKIPSGEYTNRSLVEAAFETGLPVIVSNGMTSRVERWEFARAFGSYPHVEMHCTSVYPCPALQLDLRALRWTGPVPGFSSHCPHIGPSIAAIALGARVIEHHIALDRREDGPDYTSSLLPAEFERLTIEGDVAWTALGSSRKEFYEAEAVKAADHKFGQRPAGRVG